MSRIRTSSYIAYELPFVGAQFIAPETSHDSQAGAINRAPTMDVSGSLMTFPYLTALAAIFAVLGFSHE